MELLICCFVDLLIDGAIRISNTLDAKKGRRIYIYIYMFVEHSFPNGWVSQEYIPNILEVTKGSSAGTPLADLIYSMAMSRVLSLLRERMQFEGINSAIKIGDHIHNVVEVSFVDDVAIPVFANSDEILVKTGRIVEVAYHAFLVFGMTLNFKANKSEGIVGLFGPGARKIKLELSLASYRIPIAAGDDKYFRFVKKYQHVGTILSVDLNMCDEITKRCGMMRAESRSLCSKILKCSSIPLVKKISVCRLTSCLRALSSAAHGSLCLMCSISDSINVF